MYFSVVFSWTMYAKVAYELTYFKSDDKLMVSNQTIYKLKFFFIYHSLVVLSQNRCQFEIHTLLKDSDV